MRDRTSLEGYATDYDRNWGWRKSSYSMSNGACLEIRSVARGHIKVVYIRDSKAPQGPELNFESGPWTAFLAELRTSPTS